MKFTVQLLLAFVLSALGTAFFLPSLVLPLVGWVAYRDSPTKAYLFAFLGGLTADLTVGTLGFSALFFLFSAGVLEIYRKRYRLGAANLIVLLIFLEIIYEFIRRTI